MSQNIATKVEGDKLIITVDLTKNLGPSSTGKSNLVASSEGNMSVEGTKLAGLKLGLNLFVPAKSA